MNSETTVNIPSTVDSIKSQHVNQKTGTFDLKKNTSCIRKRWLCLIMMAVMATICAVSYAIYKENSKKYFQKKELLKKYGHMFRHVGDMSATGELISHDRIPVDEIQWDTNDTCTVSCKPKEENAIIGKSKGKQYSLHGCCISHQQFISPDRLNNTEYKLRRLVQFKQRKQFFLQDVCRHIQECKRGCKCMQQNIILAALVVDDDINIVETPSDEDELTFASARIENIVYPGWCKCFNQ